MAENKNVLDEQIENAVMEVERLLDGYFEVAHRVLDREDPADDDDPYSYALIEFEVSEPGEPVSSFFFVKIEDNEKWVETVDEGIYDCFYEVALCRMIYWNKKAEACVKVIF